MTNIVTVTLNPAIDGACAAQEVRHTHKIRTTNERNDAGGGGINVGRVIQRLGGDVLAVYLAGGATGTVLNSLWTSMRSPRLCIDIDDTRGSALRFMKPARAGNIASCPRDHLLPRRSGGPASMLWKPS